MIMSIASCSAGDSDGKNKKKKDKDRDETETEETEGPGEPFFSTVAETTPDPTETPAATPTPKPTETPTPTEVPTEAPTEMPTAAPTEVTVRPDPEDYAKLGALTGFYYASRDFAESYAKDHPDAVYGYNLGWENNSKIGIFVVNDSADGMQVFRSDGDGMTEYTDYGYINEACLHSYEEFMKFPCVYESGYGWGAPVELVDTLPDGEYYGYLEAISLDGTKAYVQVGSAFYISKEEYDHLEAGDTIKLPNAIWDDKDTLTVSEVREDEYGRWVEFDDGYDLYFDSWSGEDQYMLLSASDNPEPFNKKLVILPIAPDCEVSDAFSCLAGEEAYNDFKENHIPTGNPILDSFYWHYEYEINEYPHQASNGWYEGYALLYPIVVKDGQIVRFDAEWR